MRLHERTGAGRGVPPLLAVMAALVAAIHDCPPGAGVAAWMPATSAGMTDCPKTGLPQDRTAPRPDCAKTGLRQDRACPKT